MRALVLLLSSLLVAPLAAQARPTTPPAAPPAAPAEALVDLNSATRAELEAVNGIGPTYARRIIRGRPYRAKDDLVRRGILPRGVYDKVKDRLIARQRA